jgi:hypothetical protein
MLNKTVKSTLFIMGFFIILSISGNAWTGDEYKINWEMPHINISSNTYFPSSFLHSQLSVLNNNLYSSPIRSSQIDFSIDSQIMESIKQISLEWMNDLKIGERDQTKTYKEILMRGEAAVPTLVMAIKNHEVGFSTGVYCTKLIRINCSEEQVLEVIEVLEDIKNSPDYSIYMRNDMKDTIEALCKKFPEIINSNLEFPIFSSEYIQTRKYIAQLPDSHESISVAYQEIKEIGVPAIEALRDAIQDEEGMFVSVNKSLTCVDLLAEIAVRAKDDKVYKVVAKFLRDITWGGDVSPKVRSYVMKEFNIDHSPAITLGDIKKFVIENEIGPSGYME